MSQRFSLFDAGYLAHAPACHYNEQLLVQQHEAVSDGLVKATLARLAEQIGRRNDEFEKQLLTAGEIARKFDLEPPPVPRSAVEYFNWLPKYVDLFEQNFPMSRIDHYYFLFARKCTELQVNLRFAGICVGLELELDNALQLQRRIDKCVKDSEFILFKLIAPAALLSSEPRHNFFNVYYRKINASFEPFRDLEISPDKDSMIRLQSGLEQYCREAQEGFDLCINQLRELGV